MGEEVQALLGRIDPSQFEAALAHFRDEERTWFFSGQGRSGLVAAMAAMRFMHLGRTAHVQGEATAPAIRSGDGLLMISGSARTPVSLHFGEIAKEEGAHLVLVTHEPDGPLAKIADAVLELPSHDSLQFGGSLFEQSALLTLDAIVLALGQEGEVPFATMKHLHTNLQ